MPPAGGRTAAAAGSELNASDRPLSAMWERAARAAGPPGRAELRRKLGPGVVATGQGHHALLPAIGLASLLSALPGAGRARNGERPKRPSQIADKLSLGAPCTNNDCGRCSELIDGAAGAPASWPWARAHCRACAVQAWARVTCIWPQLPQPHCRTPGGPVQITKGAVAGRGAKLKSAGPAAATGNHQDRTQW